MCTILFLCRNLVVATELICLEDRRMGYSMCWMSTGILQAREERRRGTKNTHSSSGGSTMSITAHGLLCASKQHARSSDKPAILMDRGGFLVDTSQGVINPFRTAVPLWAQISQIPSSLSPKRDCAVLNGLRRGVFFFVDETEGCWLR